MVSEMSNEREILDYSMYGNAVREPVSYTHLTLPTNREV